MFLDVNKTHSFNDSSLVINLVEHASVKSLKVSNVMFH